MLFIFKSFLIFCLFRFFALLVVKLWHRMRLGDIDLGDKVYKPDCTDIELGLSGTVIGFSYTPSIGYGYRVKWSDSSIEICSRDEIEKA
jgi:hypothetical protein